jgi:hypothetical protein
MSNSSGEHGRLGSLKAVVELCIFGPSLFGYIVSIHRNVIGISIVVFPQALNHAQFHH